MGLGLGRISAPSCLSTPRPPTLWPWVKSPLLPSPCSLDPVTPGTQAVPRPRCSLCLECPPLLSVEALLLGPQSLSAQFPPVLRESHTDSTLRPLSGTGVFQNWTLGRDCPPEGWQETLPLPFSSLLLPSPSRRPPLRSFPVQERRPWLRERQPAWRTWVDRQVAHFNL